ncbi:LOB domain-containing protein 1-like [Oryza glaberrima]|uniref:LOB domain-containing protein 1-like n=1 Tax=Oryza glaberrima TaxID=4538 RepID=UPI00224C1EA0|nr:LOB domain-containing protein 1-like [Oryza glaberrima]
MGSSSDTACTVATAPPSPTPTSPPPQLAATTVVLSPCAACKILRRRCVDRCVLAPYFPPTEPHKFTTAHRVFGASNIIKLLQELPEEQRADAVSSMVYEANARIRDPVYGCAGAICQLQKQVNDLKAQLARAHAELAGARAQHAHLVALLCMEMAAAAPPQHPTTTAAAAAYCAAVGGAASPAVPVDALYVVDGAGAAAMQASPIGWVDEPLWT